MDTKILSGVDLSFEVYTKLRERIESLKNQSITPSLAVVLVGNNPASKVYVKNKIKRFKDLGLDSSTFTFPENVTEESLLKKISDLNNDNAFHGILVQLPLPGHIDSEKILTICLLYTSDAADE